MTYPVHISKQKSKDWMDLLLINNESKSHYVYIKDFNKFKFNKTNRKTKKQFWKSSLQFLSSERILMKHKKICLEINGKQSAKLESGTIKFKDYFKQIVFNLF